MKKDTVYDVAKTFEHAKYSLEELATLGQKKIDGIKELGGLGQHDLIDNAMQDIVNNARDTVARLPDKLTINRLIADANWVKQEYDRQLHQNSIHEPSDIGQDIYNDIQRNADERRKNAEVIGEVVREVVREELAIASKNSKDT